MTAPAREAARQPYVSGANSALAPRPECMHGHAKHLRGSFSRDHGKGSHVLNYIIVVAILYTKNVQRQSPALIYCGKTSILRDMARRTDIAKLDANLARKAVAAHFRKITSKSGINYAQFQAQLQEEDMVRLLAGFAMDTTLQPTLRRECALDVITIARGKIQPWIHDGQTIDPEAVSAAGSPIKQEIDAARATAELYQELDDLVRRRIPPEQWPEAVRTLAGEAIAYYQTEGAPVLIDMTDEKS